MNTQILMAKANSLKSKKNRKGFTLVELIVVLVIIAILAAILIPTMSGYISRARKTSAQSSCKTQVTALQAAASDVIGSDSTITTTNLSKITDAAKSYGYKASTKSSDGVLGFKVTSDGAITKVSYKAGNYVCEYDSSASPQYSASKKSEGNCTDPSGELDNEANTQKATTTAITP